MNQYYLVSLFIFFYHIVFCQIDPKLYFTLSSEGIFSCNMDGSQLEHIIETKINRPFDVAFDDVNNVVYFTDSGKKTLNKINKDGSNFITIYDNELEPVTGIQLSNDKSKIYWINTAQKQVVQANNDGSNQIVLYDMGNDYFFHYQFDEDNNIIYYFNYIEQKIQKVDLNTSLISTILDLPYDPDDRYSYHSSGQIRVDTINERLYYSYHQRLRSSSADLRAVIERVNLDGTEKTVIASNSYNYEDAYFMRDFGLFPNEERIIFVEGYNNLGYLIEADLDGVVQRQIDFPEYNCRYYTHSDLSCSNSRNEFIISTQESQGIVVLSADENGVSTSQNILANEVSEPQGIVVNRNAQKIYFADRGGNKIMQADMDGSNLEPLLVRPKSSPTGLALDPNENYLFFSDFEKVYNYNMTDDLVYTIASESSQTRYVNPTALAVDIDNQQLFASWQGSAGIYRHNYFSGPGLITRSSTPYSLAVDRTNQLIFSTGTDFVMTYDLTTDAKDTLILLPPTSQIAPGGIALDPTNEKFYLLLGKQLVKSSYDGKNIDVLIENLPAQGAAYSSIAFEESHSHYVGELAEENCYDFMINNQQDILNGDNFYPLNLNIDAPIKDLNVINLDGTSEFINQLEFSIISPNGDEVALADQLCISTSSFNLNFNSTSFYELNNLDCTLDGEGKYYRPLEDLSIFNGDNIWGEWTLKIKNSSSEIANLDSWGLEICTQNPLPLSLNKLDFQVKNVKNKETEISWKSINYLNELVKYSVEHSTDGINWTQIYSISQSKNSYIFLHEPSRFTKHYYRLKYGLPNEDSQYSQTKTVLLKNKTSISLYPNPVGNICHIFSSKPVTYSLFDSCGKMLLEDVNDNTVNVEYFSRGIYFLLIQNEDEIVRKKLIRR